jgi:predicted acylesterase/phospholipase RssA
MLRLNKEDIVTYRKRSLDEHLRNDGKPKRILALDGGGLRGILTIGILQKIEDILRERHGNSTDFRLCHYFDLIAGTSTGAIIAATLAKGWTVEEIREKYESLGKNVFKKSLLRKGFLRAKYDEDKLIEELKKVYGANTKLGDANELPTGLLIIMKRLDTGSPWPIGNNPRGKYFDSHPGGTIGNGEYPLWQVVRASTAAPAYFDPQSITIIDKPGHEPLKGEFIDGGASPFNNPALQAFMYATIEGYRIGWPIGADKLLVVSIGTGVADPEVKKSNLTVKHAVNALLSLMDDCASLQETMLQWMSSSRTARKIDGELGDLQDDLVAQAPLLSYLRYNVDLRQKSVQELDPTLTDSEKIESLSSMDAPKNMKLLHRLGTLAAARDISASDFASIFDLRAE